MVFHSVDDDAGMVSFQFPLSTPFPVFMPPFFSHLTPHPPVHCLLRHPLGIIVAAAATYVTYYSFYLNILLLLSFVLRYVCLM